MTSASAPALRASAWALRTLLRLSRSRAGLVLVYHRLDEEPGDPDHEMVPAHASARFEAHLRHLAASYRIVRLEDLLLAIAARRPGQPFPVAITFDDDLASHAHIAAPILERAAAPATFFLCGATLTGPRAFWWQRLERAWAEGVALPVPGAHVREMAARIEAMTPEARSQVEALLAASGASEPEELGLRADDVRTLVDAGFSIGFHTLRHDPLTELDDLSLARALEEGRRQLEDAAGMPLTAIAYPHGKANERVARAAREGGFRLGVTGRYEAVVRDSDPLLLGRLEPTFAADARFAVQLARALLRKPHA
jgi:peptidoglycan/xylan/chitin deacetylase (PgdA/CDA1 family)